MASKEWSSRAPRAVKDDTNTKDDMLPCSSSLIYSQLKDNVCPFSYGKNSERSFYFILPSTVLASVPRCVCCGCTHCVLVFMQVLELELCHSSLHGHAADPLTSLEYFYLLFTLASQVWALQRAILEVLNFCHLVIHIEIDTLTFCLFIIPTYPHTLDGLTHSVKYP